MDELICCYICSIIMYVRTCLNVEAYVTYISIIANTHTLIHYKAMHTKLGTRTRVLRQVFSYVDITLPKSPNKCT